MVDVPVLEVGKQALCPRCNYMLSANRYYAQERIFAFSLSALLFLLLANAFPFLGFSAQGQERTVTLLQSVAILITENFPSLAVLVFAFIIFIPGLFLIGIIYVSSGLTLGRLLPGMKRILRWSFMLVPWCMGEIFLIGILVSFIKIVAIADIAIGLSFWAYILFSVCMVEVVLHLDRREFWHHIRNLSNRRMSP